MLAGERPELGGEVVNPGGVVTCKKGREGGLSPVRHAKNVVGGEG